MSTALSTWGGRFAAALIGIALLSSPAGAQEGPDCGFGLPCNVPNPKFPGCADANCCFTVCEQLPFCCILGWNQECVDVANLLCGAGDCASCTPIGEGLFIGTTSIVENDITSCAFNDTVTTWFCYTASCEGTATASTCGSAFDTALSAWDNCDGLELACNDDACGLQSTIAWPVSAGVTYFIRVSGFNGRFGDFTLDVSCQGDVGGCPGQGSCCDPKGNGTPGCDDPECCTLVCGADPFCCDVEWDPICAEEAQQQCVDLCCDNETKPIATWSRGCPPNGYNQEGMPNTAQPAFDKDLDGDGVNDSWDVPIKLPQKCGGNWATTDERGAEIFLVAIPGMPRPGDADAHYSPRFKRPGDAAGGTEVGQCVYPCGRNSWSLCFDDADGDRVPDNFTKSIFESRDGGGNWPFSGKVTTFVTDLTKKKIVPVETEKNRTPGPGFLGYTILDAVIVNFVTDLNTVTLNGALIGKPGVPIQFPGVAQDSGGTSTVVNLVTATSGQGQPGEIITAEGRLANVDTVPHDFEVVFFAVNATMTHGPVTMTLGPGEVGLYPIEAIVVGPGNSALVAMAYSETGADDDGFTDAALFLDCPWDCGGDNDGEVGIVDFLALLGQWGQIGTPCDFDGGGVGIVDFLKLLANWGACP